MPIVTISGIPVYQAIVDDEGTGMLRISLVDDPAVQSNFIAFSKDRRPMLYSIQDEEKRLVLGVVMRADFPIYRRDAADFEFYIIYKADTIRKMAERYLAENRQNLVNLMHRDGSDVEGVQMVQYFLKGRGVNPNGFDEIADGSLFAEFHVTNDEIWAAIKDGTYKGFSLEGVFDLVPEQDKESVEKIVDTLDGKFENTPTKKPNMSKIARLRAALQKVLATFGAVTTDKGVLAWDGDEDLVAGDRVYIEDQEGNRTEAPAGDYRTEDGKTIVVENGQVAEIRDPEAEVAPEPEAEAAEKAEMGRVDTDKGGLLYEGEEDLTAGVPVFVVNEEGETVPAPDGDYTTEDGKVIRVAEGVVAEILDPEAEVAPEAPEEPAGAEELEALRQENAELRAQLEELRSQPAAKPAHEEVSEGTDTFRKTGNKGLDRIAKMMEAR